MFKMKNFSSHALVILSSWLFLQCVGDPENESTYSAQEQSAAAARVIGRFESADKSVSIEICEGSSSSPAIDECADSFQIESKGNGRRIIDETKSSVGCGGCPYNGVVLPIRATLEEGGRASTWDGTANYGSDDGKSLNRPMVDVDLMGNGSESLKLVDGVIQRSTLFRGERLPTVELIRVGDANCPRP